METWYRVSRYLNTLDPVSVKSFTDKTVTTVYGRRNRIGEYEQFYSSKEEATNKLISALEKRLDQATRTADSCREALSMIKRTGTVEL